MFEELLEAGYSPVPIEPGYKRPGDYTYERWSPMKGWSRFCEQAPSQGDVVKWDAWPNVGVGVALGYRGLLALDIDTDDPVLLDVIDRVRPISAAEKRGKVGRTAFYRTDEAVPSLKLKWASGPMRGIGVIDLLSHGKQTVLPPTVHPETGKSYQWLTECALHELDIEELPTWSVDTSASLVAALEPLGVKLRVDDPIEVGRVVSSANSIPQGEGAGRLEINDEAAFAIEKWFPLLGLPKTRQRGGGLWEAVPTWRASNTGRPVEKRKPNLTCADGRWVDWGAQETMSCLDVVMRARSETFSEALTWLSIALNPELAKVDLSNFSTPNSAPPPPMHPHAIEPPAISKEMAKWDALFPRDVPPFPIDLASSCLTGVMADTYAYLSCASPMYWPEGALAATLSLFSVLTGRCYRSDTDIRTNLYIVLLGGSGWGKSSFMGPMNAVLEKAGLDDIVGPGEIKSDTGLMRVLEGNPRCLFLLDEFGHMLNKSTQRGAGGHLQGIVSTFTRLYTESHTTTRGAAYANQEPVKISCPHACIFGAATPDQFWDAMTGEQASDGMLARYTLITSDTQPGRQKLNLPAIENECEKLAPELKRIADGPLYCGLQTGAKTIPFATDAADLSDDLGARAAEWATLAESLGIRGGGPIANRIAVLAVKIAMLNAIGRNPTSPVIDEADMYLGEAISIWSAQAMHANIAGRIADNPYEKMSREVERFVREGKGKGRTSTEILRKFRGIRRRDLVEMLDVMIESQVVEHRKEKATGRGRPSEKYYGV